MERVLLEALGERRKTDPSRPPMDLNKLDDLVLYLQVHAIEKSTRKNYATGARDYARFCHNHKLPLDPTPETLSRYIAYTSQFIASGPKYLSGARHFLKEFYPSFTEARASALVQATIRGSKKIRADPVKRKPPLRTSHLQLFVDTANVTQSYDDLLFATMMACAFYGCHRMGELMQPGSKALRDWRKIIKRASLHFEPGYAGYKLPYHKGDQFYQGTDMLFTTQKIANPVELLKQYTSLRDKLHGARSALFICENGTVPTRSWFEAKFFGLVGREFGGHSARAGGATYYAGLGLSDAIIQALGRWSSEAFKIYIRDNPTVRAAQQLAAQKQASTSNS